jgi:cyclic pyranopterin phosphate synthase
MLLPVLSPHRNIPEAQYTSGVWGDVAVDNYGRPITYLRLAITDKCNLRCTYCMPEQMRFLAQKHLLTDEEILRIVSICAGFGVRKIRLTGGEPFLRPNVLELIHSIKQIRGIEEVHITTNGVSVSDKVPDLVRLGVSSVNLSMDSFDKQRFKESTRRDEFESVRATFYALLATNIHLSVNAVVMDGKNTDDILPMAELTRLHAFDMRFIEEMPFNGALNHSAAELRWNHAALEAHLRSKYPDLERLGRKGAATAEMFRIPNYKGRIGIIAGFSRTFCGACNRIRITAKGMLKTCLYDNGVLDVKHLLRDGASDDAVRERLLDCIAHRHKDGIEAERSSHAHGEVFDSMSAIGG